MRYTFELCRALDGAIPDAEFLVYSPFPVKLPVVSSRWIPRVDPWSLKGRIRGAIWLKTRLGALCRHDRLDSFWATVTFLPALPAGVKKVVTVHDVVHLVAPQTMSFQMNLPLYLFFERDVRRADAILANSQGTADRLYRTMGCRTAGIVRPAISGDFRPRSPSEIQRCREKYGITMPYVLGVGVSVRRKNIEVLIEAFTSMKRAGELDDHILVLAGPKRTGDRLLDGLIKENLASTKLLGYVPEEDLPALYSGASIFVYPSLYEGFGIPVLEARASGTRVVATDLPELREAGGDQPIYIQPTREGVRQGILDALRRLPATPLENFERPTWVESVKPLAQALVP